MADFVIGQQYNVATPQHGLKSKRPWVGITFAHRDTQGKIRTEVTAADNKNYFICSLSGYSGLFMFRIDGDAPSFTRPENVKQNPRYFVTLFAIL